MNRSVTIKWLDDEVLRRLGQPTVHHTPRFQCFRATPRDLNDSFVSLWVGANAQSSFFQIVISAGLANISAQFCLKA
jgi:hypothetical protein